MLRGTLTWQQQGNSLQVPPAPCPAPYITQFCALLLCLLPLPFLPPRRLHLQGRGQQRQQGRRQELQRAAGGLGGWRVSVGFGAWETQRTQVELTGTLSWIPSKQQSIRGPCISPTWQARSVAAAPPLNTHRQQVEPGGGGREAHQAQRAQHSGALDARHHPRAKHLPLGAVSRRTEG